MKQSQGRGRVRSGIFVAVAQSALLACAVSRVLAEDAPKLDANGQVCAGGKLDGAGQCISLSQTRSSADHPYREAGASDGRTTGRIGPGFNLVGGRELVYAAVPGSIIVFDAKPDAHGNRKFNFVRRILFQDRPAPLPPESISALMASPATNMIYVSTRGRLVAIDLTTEKIVWEKIYEPGTCCERGAVTPDGLTLIVGSDLKDFHRVIDARTGEVKGIIKTPLSMFNHNMNLSADGKTDFAAPNGLTMSIADVPSQKVTKTITFSDHIRVFVINHNASRIYVNLNNLLGFEIADVKSGKVVKRIEAPAEMWKAKWADPNLVFFGHGAPMHGIALTPDESEVWLPDAISNQVLVYDNTGESPVLNMNKSFKTNGQPNGWITMGLDGKLAYMASGDVVEVKSHHIVGQLKDEYGRYMDCEKVLDMTFNDRGHLLRTVNQFAQGDPKAVANRLAMEAPATHAGTLNRTAGTP
jgi:DNA-binding beta-propeller fold protein YncE